MINADKSSTFQPVLSELEAENATPKKIKLRAIKYLSNRMENDYKFTKSKSRYCQWYQSFLTARNTLDGIETMRMIQKGQVRHIGKNVVKQNNFIRSLTRISSLVC